MEGVKYTPKFECLGMISFFARPQNKENETCRYQGHANLTTSLPEDSHSLILKKLVGRWKIPFWKISFFLFFLDDFRSFSSGEFEKKINPCHSFLGFAVSLSQATNPTAIPQMHLAGPATATWPSDARIRAPMAWRFRWFGGSTLMVWMED